MKLELFHSSHQQCIQRTLLHAVPMMFSTFPFQRTSDHSSSIYTQPLPIANTLGSLVRWCCCCRRHHRMNERAIAGGSKGSNVCTHLLAHTKYQHHVIFSIFIERWRIHFSFSLMRALLCKIRQMAYESPLTHISEKERRIWPTKIHWQHRE